MKRKRCGHIPGWQLKEVISAVKCLALSAPLQPAAHPSTCSGCGSSSCSCQYLILACQDGELERSSMHCGLQAWVAPSWDTDFLSCPCVAVRHVAKMRSAVVPLGTGASPSYWRKASFQIVRQAEYSVGNKLAPIERDMRRVILFRGLGVWSPAPSAGSYPSPNRSPIPSWGAVAGAACPAETAVNREDPDIGQGIQQGQPKGRIQPLRKHPVRVH